MALAVLFIVGGLGLAGYGLSSLQQDEAVPAKTETPTGASKVKREMMRVAITPERLTELQKANKSFLLVVFAPWCGACRYFSATFASAVQAGVSIYSLDGDAHASAVAGIRAFPTIIRYKDGEEVERREGGMSVGELKKFARK